MRENHQQEEVTAHPQSKTAVVVQLNGNGIAHKKNASNGGVHKAKTRYSKEELKEFKDAVLKKLALAEKEHKYYAKKLENSFDGRINDGSNEDSVSDVEKENFAEMKRRQAILVDKLEKALVRIGNGTYGKCRSTGDLISRERLLAVPHATLSIEAKRARE